MWAPPRGWRILSAVNNIQIALPDSTLLGPQLYNQVFTMHGTVDDVPVRRADREIILTSPRVAIPRHMIADTELYLLVGPRWPLSSSTRRSSRRSRSPI